jgi:hypothetical protein
MKVTEKNKQKASVTLDDATVAYLVELNEAMEKARQAASQPYILQMQAALQLFIRQRGLEGNWQLAPDGKTITRE